LNEDIVVTVAPLTCIGKRGTIHRMLWMDKWMAEPDFIKCNMFLGMDGMYGWIECMDACMH